MVMEGLDLHEITSEEDTEQFFYDLESIREELFKELENLKDYVTKCTLNPIKNLINLNAYFKTDIGKTMFDNFSEVQKLYTIISILNMEEVGKSEYNFFYKVNDYNTLIDKYDNTIFYLRRIEMNYAEITIDEIFNYFVQLKISAYALYGLCQDGLLLHKVKIICDLYILADGTQIQAEAKKLLLLYMSNEDGKREVITYLVNYYLERHDIKTAYTFMKTLDNLTSDEKSLRQKLERLLNNES